LSPSVHAEEKQGDLGILVGRDWIVYAINMGGPADEANIKPGDKIISINGKPTANQQLEIFQNDFTGEVGKAIYGVVSSKGEERNVSLKLRLLTDDEYSTFLVLGNKNSVYTTIIDVLTFDNSVAALFPIQFTDKETGIIRTQGSASVHGKVIRKLIKLTGAYGNYSGVSLNAMNVSATFRIREINNEYTAVRTAFLIRVQAVSVFVGAFWTEATSNGTMEKALLTRMYNATKTAEFILNKSK
jgi:hypothetical protein